MLYELIHNGVVVPEPPKPRGLQLKIRGQWIPLTAKQEEMALAWAKKQGTPYVQDPVFISNFLADFSRALGVEPPLTLQEVDFSPAIAVVVAEKEAKEALTREERKALAAERKAQREALKERYGYAIVNGERVELGNYVVEPSGIFMGRGEHPLRGRWKEGAQESDITLNLSPNAPRPPGNWAGIVWEPESLWVARWQDKLSGKLKYVWLGDTAQVKQLREIAKFDEAAELGAKLDAVRAHIAKGLADADPKRRMVATACYLIDALCLRVGDEKDPDEADTVGATTLRPEHVKLHPNGVAEFHFLGKDSVLWHKKVVLPEQVTKNLAELIENARPPSNNKENHPSRDLPQLFPDISSRDVNSFLAEVVPWLSAKIFRTHHATQAVAQSLHSAKVKASDPDYLKWQAASLANREAAVLCNHYKKESASWPRSKARMEERQRKAEARLEECRRRVVACRDRLEALRQEARDKLAAASSPAVEARRRASYARRIAAAEEKLRKAKEMEKRAKVALGRLKAKELVASRSRTWNLVTSLKSYIDPRVYTRWGEQIGYDVLECYYPQALRRRFAWAKSSAAGQSEEAPSDATPNGEE